VRRGYRGAATFARSVARRRRVGRIARSRRNARGPVRRPEECSGPHACPFGRGFHGLWSRCSQPRHARPTRTSSRCHVGRGHVGCWSRSTKSLKRSRREVAIIPTFATRWTVARIEGRTDRSSTRGAHRVDRFVVIDGFAVPLAQVDVGIGDQRGRGDSR